MENKCYRNLVWVEKRSSLSLTVFGDENDRFPNEPNRGLILKGWEFAGDFRDLRPLAFKRANPPKVPALGGFRAIVRGRHDAGKPTVDKVSRPRLR